MSAALRRGPPAAAAPVTRAAVTLRPCVPAAAAVGGVPFEFACPYIAWLCRLPRLALSEWRRRHAPPPR